MCPHLSNRYWDHGEKKPNGASMTKTKMVCSTERRELESWAESHYGQKPQRCPDC
jgi:hypothetical protein